MSTIISTSVRPLARADVGAVAAIDASIRGHSRAPYLERRVAAALREPSLHVQLAAENEDGVAAFLIARVLEGEFGRVRPVLQLDVIGVRREAQHHGIGAVLFEALAQWAKRHEIAEIHTEAAWTDASMLRWLERNRFELAAYHVVDCAVETGGYAPARPTEHARTEIDYSGASEVEALARDLADVRTMVEADLADITRIDRHITGRDRSAYIQHKLGEALNDSGVRVSLTARTDGEIAGYLMARADYGDFGRPEAVAVLDTIGVDPAFTHRGIGHALLSQLCVNLSALQIERVETMVAPHDLGLLGFLHEAGFAPSQRLPFSRRLDR